MNVQQFESVNREISSGPAMSRYIISSQLEDGSDKLVNLWLIFSRQKRVFALIFALFVIGAAALIFLMNPVYESEAVIEIGKISGVADNIENPAALVKFLEQKYRVDDSNHNRVLPLVETVGREKEAPQLVTITAIDHSPEGVQSYLNKIISPILDSHEKKYAELRGLRESELQSITNQISTIEGRYDSLAHLTKDVTDRSQAAIMAVEQGSLLSVLADLQKEKAKVSLSLADGMSYQTRLISAPFLPTEPIKPKPVLIMVIGVMLGLIFGVASVFVGEMAHSVKKRLQDRSSSQGK